MACTLHVNIFHMKDDFNVFADIVLHLSKKGYAAVNDAPLLPLFLDNGITGTSPPDDATMHPNADELDDFTNRCFETWHDHHAQYEERHTLGELNFSVKVLGRTRRGASTLETSNTLAAFSDAAAESKKLEPVRRESSAGRLARQATSLIDKMSNNGSFKLTGAVPAARTAALLGIEITIIKATNIPAMDSNGYRNESSVAATVIHAIAMQRSHMSADVAGRVTHG